MAIMENHNIPRKLIGSCMVDPLELAKGNTLSRQDPRQIYRKPQTLRRRLPLSSNEILHLRHFLSQLMKLGSAFNAHINIES